MMIDDHPIDPNRCGAVRKSAGHAPTLLPCSMELWRLTDNVDAFCNFCLPK